MARYIPTLIPDYCPALFRKVVERKNELRIPTTHLTAAAYVDEATFYNYLHGKSGMTVPHLSAMARVVGLALTIGDLADVERKNAA